MSSVCSQSRVLPVYMQNGFVFLNVFWPVFSAVRSIWCLVYHLLRESYAQSYSCIVSNACLQSHWLSVCRLYSESCVYQLIFIVCVPSIPFYDMWAIRFVCCLECRSSHVLSRRPPVSLAICVPSVQCFASLPTKLCCMCGICPKICLWAEYFHGMRCNCSCFVCVLITL